VFALRRVEKDGLWEPGPVNLLAVQSSFLRGRKLLRATRSEFVARGLHDLTKIRPGFEAPHLRNTGID